MKLAFFWRICGGINVTCSSQGQVRLQRPHGLHTQPSGVREAIMNDALAINFLALIFGHVVPTAVSQRFFLRAVFWPLPQPPHPPSPCLCCLIVLTYQRPCVCVCVCLWCVSVADLCVQVTVWKWAQQHSVQLQVDHPATGFTFTRTRTRARSVTSFLFFFFFFFSCRMLVKVGRDGSDEDEAGRLCCGFPAWPDDCSWRTRWDSSHHHVTLLTWALLPRCSLYRCCFVAVIQSMSGRTDKVFRWFTAFIWQ